MTAEEACKWLYVHFAPCVDGTKQDDAISTALDALKKQIPMKPILCDDEDLTCPTCGADVEWKYYCEECGQKIDHEEE